MTIENTVSIECGDKWQSKTLFLSIFDPRSSIVDIGFNCRLPSVSRLRLEMKTNQANICMCETAKRKATVVKITVSIRNVQNKTKSKASITSCQSQSNQGPITFVHSPSTSSSSTSFEEQHPGRQRCCKIHFTIRTNQRGN